MTRVAIPLALVSLVVVALGLSVSGCRQTATSDANASAVHHSPAQPTPEERFQRIVDTFRRSVDTNASGIQAGFLYRDEGGHSSLSVRNDVTEELIPPTKEGDPYRGMITVTRQISYSMHMTPADSNDGKSEGHSRNSGSTDHRSLDDQSQDNNGVDVLDPNLIAAATRSDKPSPTQPEDTVARRSDKDVRTYELAYENDRWVLKTQLDLKTEQSIQAAFEHALAIQ
jgi:hypothetical protein